MRQEVARFFGQMKERKERHMKKLNGKDLFFMAMGATIGAGIITNTGVAIGMAGSGVIIAYLMAFAVMYVSNLPTMFFASVHPVMSPAYVMTSWVSKKVAGFWLYCQIFAAFAQAYMGVAFGTYVASIFTGISPSVSACVIVTVFFLLNLLDLKTSAKVQNITTAFLLLVLFSFVALGLPKCNLSQLFSSESMFYGGTRGIFDACASVLFGVGGCTVLMNFGPQIENPKRNISRMYTITFICAFLAFGLVAFVGSGVAPIAEVAGKPMTYQAKIIYPGNWHLLFVIGGALLAIITTINSNYQRYWSSILRGVDEGWLPAFFGKRNKHDIPWVLMVLFWLMALIPNLFGLNIGQLVSLASAVTLIPMLIPIWGFLKLPEGDPQGWQESKLSKVFASKISRVLFCAFCTALIGIFVVLNVLRFSTVAIVFVTIYFAVAIIICVFFGDKLLKNGEARLAAKNNQ